MLGAALVLTLLIVNAALAYLATITVIKDNNEVARSQELIRELEVTLSLLKDSETGQRGYIITGVETYLEPYQKAAATMEQHLTHLKQLTTEHALPQHHRLMPHLEEQIRRRLKLVSDGIALRRTQGFNQAQQFILTNEGKHVMDDIRLTIAAMEQEEEARLLRFGARLRASERNATTTLIVGALLSCALVALSFYLIRRDVAARDHEAESLRRAHEQLEQRVLERTESLRATTVELQRSNRELQDFAFVASHDLQEPLRKIQAFGDRIRTKEGAAFSNEGRDYLQRMLNAAGRMQTLIQDLLTFSRVTTKAQPFATVDLNTVAREVLNDLETRIEQSGGRVELSNLPTIEADPLQMRQLLQNLIGNALKFSRPGTPPVIRVSGEIIKPEWVNGTDGEGLARLSFADNGIGFDEKYLDRIFTPFQRLHARSEYEGTGMGLAVCRKIVERHGGQITAQSQPEQGATFLVTLPATRPEIKQADEIVATNGLAPKP